MTEGIPGSHRGDHTWCTGCIDNGKREGGVAGGFFPGGINLNDAVNASSKFDNK